MSMPGDITFDSGTSWWGQNLTDFVLNGTIAESRVDDMATRILASWYLLGQDSPDYPPGQSPVKCLRKLRTDVFLFQSTSTRSTLLIRRLTSMSTCRMTTSRLSGRSGRLTDRERRFTISAHRPWPA